MKKIKNISELDPNGLYTYADYLTWQFEQTVELIHGKILAFITPNRKHQRLSWRLSAEIDRALRNSPCHAYAAPFDVRLVDAQKSAKAHKDVLSVVQPDISIICDLQKLDERGCLGAPDVVFEILSAGNSKKEMILKKNLYEENGVREYLIVDPTHQIVFQYVLDGETFAPPQFFGNDDQFSSAVFPNLTFDLSNIFESEEI